MSQASNPRVAELAALCKRQRQGKKASHYNEKVKSLVCELVASGVENVALARTAGVSSATIRNWVKEALSPTAQRQPVKILNVEGMGNTIGPARLGSDGATERGRMVMMIRVAEFDVAIYGRDGGRP